MADSSLYIYKGIHIIYIISAHHKVKFTDTHEKLRPDPSWQPYCAEHMQPLETTECAELHVTLASRVIENKRMDVMSSGGHNALIYESHLMVEHVSMDWMYGICPRGLAMLYKT
jgi:hypothetical protein